MATVDEYDGEWMETYTGDKFHFTKPRPEEIHIEDIAHHLSLLCRYTGACKFFYSVAQHSLYVAQLVPEELQLTALLHDAAEAYLNDISRPVKYSHRLDITEQEITKVIDAKYGINSHHPDIKLADDIMLATEAGQLMKNMTDWKPLPQPVNIAIHQVAPYMIESAFLDRFREYGGVD